MDGLSVAASIIAVVQIAGSVISYLSDVKNAPKECKKCQIEASLSNALLLRLEDRLGESSAAGPWFDEVQALARKDGPLAQYKLSLAALLAKIEPKSKLRNALNILLWSSIKEDVALVLATIERVKTLIGIALEMDHFKLSLAIKEDTTFVRNTLPSIQADVGAIRNTLPSLQTNQHATILEWLSPTDFLAQQHDIISRRAQGTGQWFLDSPKFERWLQGADKTLFCPGMPGAGKTMMAAVVINHFYATAPGNDTGVAFIFCNYKAQADQTAQGLLAALLMQLVHRRPDLAAPVSTIYNKHAKERTRPSIDDISYALDSVCSSLTAVYIIVDALDECTEEDRSRSQLIDKLRELQAKVDLRLLFTSRDIPDIAQKFQSESKLEVQASQEDVRRFVIGQIPRLPTCIRRDEKLQYIVQEKITEAVDGM
ncbi:hypothetical protein BGZ57DRAFT_759893 [Hyaloscypha finlandica]|nr:hypothetical protein BGZ57DRAFT_759893 [Hyaloscypha finlandica]